MNSERLVTAAAKVKLPLSLAGVVVVVLYAIYRQMLALGVFENIGGAATSNLLNAIVDRLFWLALVAVVLGIASYVVTHVFSHARRKSSVRLVDARHDESLSEYRDASDGTKAVSRPQ